MQRRFSVCGDPVHSAQLHSLAGTVVTTKAQVMSSFTNGHIQYLSFSFLNEPCFSSHFTFWSDFQHLVNVSGCNFSNTVELEFSRNSNKSCGPQLLKLQSTVYTYNLKLPARSIYLLCAQIKHLQIPNCYTKNTDLAQELSRYSVETKNRKHAYKATHL